MWTTGTVAALLVVIGATPVQAQGRRGDNAEDAIRRLEREVAALKAEVKKLQTSRDAERRAGPGNVRAPGNRGGGPGMAQRRPGGFGMNQPGFGRGFGGPSFPQGGIGGPQGGIAPRGMAFRGGGFAGRPGFGPQWNQRNSWGFQGNRSAPRRPGFDPRTSRSRDSGFDAQRPRPSMQRDSRPGEERRGGPDRPRGERPGDGRRPGERRPPAA